MTVTESRTAYAVSAKSMAVNLLLFAIKGMFGLLSHSASLISDAVHSLSDIFSTLVVMLGIRFSERPADKSHPYGHDKFECLVAFLLGLMLFFIGGTIALRGLLSLFTGTYAASPAFAINICAAIAAVLSIVAKEWAYRFTIKCARQIDSPSMAADAWHHRSDALSSIGSLVGVIGIAVGLPAVDSLACLAISIFIFKAASDICADACKNLVDASAGEAMIHEMEQIIRQNAEVISIDLLKTRRFGSGIYVDIEVTLDKNMSFQRSHRSAHKIHDSIEKNIRQVRHCMVHVNPSA